MSTRTNPKTTKREDTDTENATDGIRTRGMAHRTRSMVGDEDDYQHLLEGSQQEATSAAEANLDSQDETAGSDCEDTGTPQEARAEDVSMSDTDLDRTVHHEPSQYPTSTPGRSSMKLPRRLARTEAQVERLKNRPSSSGGKQPRRKQRSADGREAAENDQGIGDSSAAEDTDAMPPPATVPPRKKTVPATTSSSSATRRRAEERAERDWRHVILTEAEEQREADRRGLKEAKRLSKRAISRGKSEKKDAHRLHAMAAGDGRRVKASSSRHTRYMSEPSSSEDDDITDDDQGDDPWRSSDDDDEEESEHESDNESAPLPHRNRSYLQLGRMRSEVTAPKFDGANWMAFKTQFGEACQINEWNARERASRLRCALTGDAMAFLSHPKCLSWPYSRLIAALDQRYGKLQSNNDIADAVMDMVMKPGQSVYKFADEINAQLGRGHFSRTKREMLGWHAFTKGLKAHNKPMRRYVIRRVKDESYSKAVTLAAEFELQNGLNEEGGDDEWALLAEASAQAGRRDRTGSVRQVNTQHEDDADRAGILKQFADRLADRIEAAVANVRVQHDTSTQVNDASHSSVYDSLESENVQIKQLQAQVASLQQAVGQKNPNKVELVKTPDIPPAAPGNNDKRVNLLAQKLLALETVVELREANRQEAINRNKNGRGRGGYRGGGRGGYHNGGNYNNNGNSGYNSNSNGNYNNNNNYNNKPKYNNNDGGNTGYQNGGKKMSPYHRIQQLLAEHDARYQPHASINANEA